MSIRIIMLSGMACAVLCGLAACNRSQASAGRHDQTAGGGGQAGGSAAYAAADSGYRRSSGGYGSGGYGSGGYRDEAREAVPLFHGEPMWSENRNHTAQENAEYQFRRSAPDLGVKTLDAFLTKVHAFGDHPPPGALHIERSNGDKLVYDPKTNLFGVFTRDGAPRTIFKPRDGMEYWNEQKAREVASGSESRSSRRYGGQDSGDRPAFGDDRADRGQ